MSESKPEKYILVVGATGSGKTTWINGIANWLYGVQWTDSFRFQIVTEEDESGSRNSNQAFSQTDYVTSYRFVWQPGFPCNFNVILIDTPGFADTRGISRDERIVLQLKILFEAQAVVKADRLDAIALVVQSSNVRLTAVQKYIFGAILSIFGRDVIQNLLLMATFADGGNPPVLAAIRQDNIEFHECLKFNNSALFTQNSGDDMARLFWDIGIQSYQQCFQLIGQLQPQSLVLTREVLRERENLQLMIQGIHREIQQGIAELDEIDKEERILNQHELDIDANRNYTTNILIHKEEQIRSPPGRHVTNCISCNCTCHLSCIYSDDKDKIDCCAMKHGYCTVCPRKCHWTQHKNQPFHWEHRTVEVTRTADELKRKYMGAVSGKANAETMLANLHKRYNTIKDRLRQNVDRARQCVNHLNEIAARANPLSELDYIDLLIESEQMEKKSGWQMRAGYLWEARQMAETRAAIVQPGEFIPKQFAQRKRK